MALTSLLFGICLHFTAKFNLGMLIQLMPFPVVCGFLAGTGWLFLEAAITTTTDVEVDLNHIRELFSYHLLIRWVPALACGIVTTSLMHWKDHFLILPACLLACVCGFYALTFSQGISLAELQNAGWVFKLDHTSGEKGISNLDFSGINIDFVLSVLPEIATIVFICMLSASFAFSALELGSGRSLAIGRELQSHSRANIISALGLGLPGITDVAYSIMYHKMGATSRLPALITSALCFTAAFVGGNFVEYLPKLLVGTLVFLAAIHLLHDWLIEACRKMNRSDQLIVWLIFSVIVLIDFIPGILIGMILTSLMFIIRYSKIEIVGSTFSLDQLSSSVDRSARESAFIREFGKRVNIFNLRGFLFFGSANVFFERIKLKCQKEKGIDYFIFDFRRVLGIDSTAVQVFEKLINLLNSENIKPVFCGMNPLVREAFRVSNILDESQLEPLVLDTLDLSLVWVEERLLFKSTSPTPPSDIVAILGDILGDTEKAKQMHKLMQRQLIEKGDYLFRQGDNGSSFYVIESGSIEVRLEQPNGTKTRLREFRRGTVVGEMAAYSSSKSRSASAIAVETTVVYSLARESLSGFGNKSQEYEVILHEFVARLLAARLQYMNKRTEIDV